MKRTWTVPAIVERVVDGDSVWVRLDLGWHVYHRVSVRIASVNAPELRTDEGKLIKLALIEYLPVGAEVMVVSDDLDKYGRTLGDIVYNDKKISDWLLENGYAERV